MSQHTENWADTVEWSRVVAACIVYRDGKYLMVQEGQPRAYGLWNVPAGHVDKGESIEDAAVRETKEETGYTVELQQKIGIYHEEVARPVKHVYTAKIVSGSINPEEDEILAVEWLTYDEIEQLQKSGKLRAIWIWPAIKYAGATRGDA